MCDVVIVTDHCGAVRIPGYIRKALHQWISSSDFPKDVPIRIEKQGMVINLIPPGKKPLRTPWTERQRRKRKAGGQG